MAYHFLFYLFNSLPMGFWRVLAFPISLGLFVFSKRERQIALTQIKFVFPHLNEKKLLLGAYDSVIFSLIETFRLRKILAMDVAKADKHIQLKSKLGAVECIGIGNVQELIDKNEGVVCIGSHLSNFELMTAFFSYQGLPLSVIARSPNKPRAKKILDRLRRSYGVEVIWREDKKSANQLLSAIRSHRMICALIDQDINLENGFSKFFGLEAAHPIAPIKIALKFKRPVLLCNLIRKKNFSYTLLLQRVHWEDKDDPQQYILDEFSKNLEKLMSEIPDQWVWWHRRWRRRPGIDYEKNPELLPSTKSYLSWLKSQSPV